MKRLLIIICLTLFLLLPITAQAKDYSKSLKTVNFSTLSNKDMEDTINSLVSQISRELALPYTPRVSCYEYDWAVLAHNTLIPIGDYGPTICVNLQPFKTDPNTNIVFTIAHEVRHSYQYEHQYDDSDYGRAIKQGYEDYTSWYEDLNSYYIQFIELDANDYAKQYADKYFK